MSLAPYTYLYPFMLSKLGSCPKSTVLQELRLAGQEFADETESWRFLLAPIAILANTASYNLQIPYDATLKRIDSVYRLSASTDPKTSWMTLQTWEYDLANDLTLVLRNTPTVTAEYLVPLIVLVPHLSTNELDENYLSRWGRRGIMAKAMYRLLSMKRKPWFDDVLAEEYRQQYVKATTEARANNERQNKGGDMRVIPRRFV